MAASKFWYTGYSEREMRVGLKVSRLTVDALRGDRRVFSSLLLKYKVPIPKEAEAAGIRESGTWLM